MGIFDKIGSGFQSLGHWMDSNIVQPFSNKVISPIFNAVTKPIRISQNFATGVEKMSEAWANRAGAISTDVINAGDKAIVGFGNTIEGVGNFFSTPIIPIALGLGALYIIKK